jgi:hypothetical protein
LREGMEKGKPDSVFNFGGEKVPTKSYSYQETA